MNSRNKRRLKAVLLGIGAAIALMIAAYATQSDDKKHDDRPMGTEHTAAASLAPAPDPLKAEPVSNQDMCSKLLDEPAVESRAHQGRLTTKVQSGNTDRASWNDMFCTYHSSSNQPVGQASYQVLKPKGLKLYQTARDGQDSALFAKHIPTREMPFGVTSAFYFTPAATSADNSSWYRNPGAQMLVGNTLVVISLQDFDTMPAGLRKVYMNNALKDVIGTK